jgi:hypothetical protein
MPYALPHSAPATLTAPAPTRPSRHEFPSLRSLQLSHESTSQDAVLLCGLQAPLLGRIAVGRCAAGSPFGFPEDPLVALAVARPRPAAAAGLPSGPLGGGLEPGTLTIEATLEEDGVQRVHAALEAAGGERAGWVRLQLTAVPKRIIGTLGPGSDPDLAPSDDLSTSEEGGASEDEG